MYYLAMWVCKILSVYLCVGQHAGSLFTGGEVRDQDISYNSTPYHPYETGSWQFKKNLNECTSKEINTVEDYPTEFD